MSDLKKFIMQVPAFTRYMTGLTFGMSLLMSFGILNPYNLVLVFDQVFSKYPQIWRLITTYLFAGKFGPGFLFTILMLYFTCKRVDD